MRNRGGKAEEEVVGVRCHVLYSEAFPGGFRWGKQGQGPRSGERRQ